MDETLRDNPAAVEPSVITDVTVDTPDEERVEALMEQESIDVAKVAPLLEMLDPPDAADRIEELDQDDAISVMQRMDPARAAAILSEMTVPLAADLISRVVRTVGPELPARLLDLMDPDDAVDRLQSLPDEDRPVVLAALPPMRAEQLQTLARYDPETAGGMMDPRFVAVPATTTIEQAARRIARSPLKKGFNHVYCVDARRRLVGIMSLRKLLVLLVQHPERRVEDCMRREVDVLRPDLDREEVADAFDRYNYTTMPVVSPNGHLLGVVTVDDVINIIRAENTEDQYLMVGAGQGEAVYSGLRQKFRGRLPWLIVNLFTSFLAAFVVWHFDDAISRFAMLAVLMPVIANQAGNAGQQSLAVTLRGLVLGEVRSRRVAPLVLRELGLGLLTGLLVGSVVALVLSMLGRVGVLDADAWKLGLVAMVAMTISLGVGCLVGTAMPLLMDRLDRDPATASTIFLTMVTDSVSFLTFLGLWSLRDALAG